MQDGPIYCVLDVIIGGIGSLGMPLEVAWEEVSCMDRSVFGNMIPAVYTRRLESPKKIENHANLSMDTPSVAELLEDFTNPLVTISEGERTSNDDTTTSPTTISQRVARR